jgi:hypothetical protein
MGGYIHISEDVIKLWKKDFSTIPGKEEIKIVSGELNCDLYKAIKPDIEKAVNDYGVEVQIIAGPVISIDNGNKYNAALELLEKGYIRLYISPTRQLYHYRVFGDRFAYEEEYHEALDIERLGKYNDSPLAISRLSFEFDQIKDALEMPIVSNPDNLVTETMDIMLKVKEICQENYDFLTADEFRENAEQFH